MSLDTLQELPGEILDVAEDHLYPVMFVLLLIEEAGIPLPLPGDTLILLAGSRVSAGQASVWTAMALVVSATLIGSSALYWVARWGGMPVVRRLAGWMRISEAKLDRAVAWYRRWTGPAIVFGRLTPGFRIVTTAVAGSFGVPYPQFLLYTGVSAVVWASVYLTVGALVQDAYERVGSRLFPPSPLALLLLAFLAAALVVALRRRRGAPTESDE
jgi:membrane protein DedA with SNARE-associated domain